jgi:hypothetical protein
LKRRKNDSQYNGERSFDPEDISIDLNNENSRTDLFDSEKWGVGSRQDQEPLTFSTVPGRRVPLPETTTVSDYFNIFNIVDLTSRESVGTPLPLLILFYAIVSDNKVET